MKLGSLFNTGTSAFSQESVRFNGKSAAGNGSTKSSNNNSALALEGVKNESSKSLKDAIERIKEEMENISKNGELSDDEKKSKLESLTEQLTTLEEMAEKQRSQELSDTIKNINNEEEQNLTKKVKERKSQFNKFNKPKQGVDLSISEAAFKGIVTAEMELEKSKEFNRLSAQYEAEAVMKENELENDTAQGQSVQDSLKSEAAAETADKISEEAAEDFAEKYPLEDFLADAKSDEERLYLMNFYQEAMSEYASLEVKKVIESPEFNANFEFKAKGKEAEVEKLGGIIENLNSISNEALEKANDEIEKIDEAERSEEDGASTADGSEESTKESKSISDTIASNVNKVLDKEINKLSAPKVSEE